jgi:ArsR family metal-binding transcriptional regulator
MDKELIKTSGVYQPKTKFVEFIGGKGYVNFISNEATISAKSLSGLYFEDITLKLTIYEDGTVDLDEVDTTKTTVEERQRLLDVIEDQSLGSYRNRTVVNELMFTSVEKVKDKNVPLYLAVEYTTPIEKLSSLFDDRLLVPNEISDDAMDNLNDLLNSWFEDEEFAKEIEEMINEENSEEDGEFRGFIPDPSMHDHDSNIEINSAIEDSFSKMKEEKLDELKSKKSKTKEEIFKIEFQISNLSKSLETAKSDLNLLEERIFDLKPVEDSVGYYFNVSERLNEVVSIDENTERIIREKISKVKSINVENFMKLFSDGEFAIKLSKKTDTAFEVVEDFKDIPKDIIEKLDFLSLDTNENKLIYNGELSWGEVVNKFIKLGFEQDPEFDKFCGSNSYSSIETTKEEVKTKKTKF